MIADEHPGEVQDTDSVVAEVETVSTWRDALLAHLRPADHRISDEEIFTILNDAGEGRSTAELCAASGVTVSMYCVWKSKYRQLGLDEGPDREAELLVLLGEQRMEDHDRKFTLR